MDKIDISEINERSKKIWVEKKDWENIKFVFNKEGADQGQMLVTIRKGTKIGDAICLKVFKKNHQDFLHNHLGKDKEVVRAGMDIECFEKLSELNSITCDLYGHEETLEWINNNKDNVVIVTITRPRNFFKIRRRALRNSRKRSLKEKQIKVKI